MKMKIRSVISFVLVVIMCLSVFCGCKKDKVSDKETLDIVGKSEGYEIDKGMLTYYVNSEMMYMHDYYYYNYGQEIDLSGDDYKDSFFSYAKEILTQYTALATEAKKNGIALDKDDMKEIDGEINSIEDYAKENDSTMEAFLHDCYGSTVDEKVVRRCFELEALAKKYYDSIVEKCAVSDDDVSKYFEDHPEKFRMVDFISYSFDGSVERDATDADKAAMLSENKKKAKDFISGITDEQSIRDAINKIERQKAKDSKGDDITDEEIKTIDSTDYSAKYEKSGYMYNSESEVAKWAFEDGRKAGDIRLFDSDTGCTVYYLLKTDYYDNYRTGNVRYILIGKDGEDEAEGTAKATAEKVLKEYESGKKTEDAFAELAKTYSKDSSTASDGGLYENLDKGVTVPELNDWVFDGSRKSGDYGIVSSEAYGYFLIYYIGENEDEKWKITAKEAIIGERTDTEMQSLAKKYPVEWYEDKVAQIEYNG